MIVDVHAHFNPDISAFTADRLAQMHKARGQPVIPVTDYNHYWDNAPQETKVVIFGGKAKRSGVWRSDEKVAEQVKADPGRYTGFLSVDLAVPGWEEELRYGHQVLGLSGVKLLPMYAGFYPHDRKFDGFWEYVVKHNLPVLLHTGTTFVSQAPLDCTFPRYLDDVAIRFPDAKIIMAHLGHPFEGEAIVVARKHPNVYTDISALYYRPWQLFNSLMLVTEYKIWPKILFGSDYPYTTVNDTLAGLERLCNVNVSGFQLPRDEVDAMIHRDSLKLLLG